MTISVVSGFGQLTPEAIVVLSVSTIILRTKLMSRQVEIEEIMPKLTHHRLFRLNEVQVLQNTSLLHLTS
jgi:hypothetical protein